MAGGGGLYNEIGEKLTGTKKRCFCIAGGAGDDADYKCGQPGLAEIDDRYDHPEKYTN